jgi:hypothetical protein
MRTRDTAALVAKMCDVFFPDAKTVLDVTYGNGKFWEKSSLAVTGMDIDPNRAKDVCGDFTKLPFQDDAFDLVAFDPPYQTDMGRGKASVMGARFGVFKNIHELQLAVKAGCREAARVSRIGVLVKTQDYIHASRLVHMTNWVESAIGLPLYDEVIQMRANKILDPKWGPQLSAYRNSATYQAFRHDGPVHKRRKV